MNKKFRIGIINSTTGLWQGNQIASLISPSSYQTEIFSFDDKSNLEKAIVDQAIELAAIHPNQLTNGMAEELELIALTERQPVNDIVLSRNQQHSLTDNHSQVGVTSALRLAFVRHYYPTAKPVPTPDIGTCIANFEKNELDLVVMGFDELLPYSKPEFQYEKIETSYFVPSLGQGTIAVLCHKKLSYRHKEILQRWVNHEETEDCIRAEWTYLKALPENNEMLPFSYAFFEGAIITIKAGLISSDGKEIYKTKKSAALGEARELGKKVALELARLYSEQRVQSI